MLIAQHRGPGHDALRPSQLTRAAGFPVHPDLVSDLVQARDVSAPNWKIAHVLGTCAGYAYASSPTLATIMARLGLEQNHCVELAERIDAMFVCSTAFLVQSRCGRVVILCYRGTEAANVVNWLTDADVEPEAFALGGRDGERFDVHSGFYRNTRATRHEVLSTLARTLHGEALVEGAPAPGHPLEALYLTGHSLGGAMATLMGVMIATEEACRPLAAKLRAVYTFGQPMVGTRRFADRCAAQPLLSRTYARFVHGYDLVPALPPAVYGDFAHFGPEYRYAEEDGGRAWRRSLEPTGQLRDPAGIPLPKSWFQLGRPPMVRFDDLRMPRTIRDHGPHHYVAALTEKNGVRSELGD